jgi:uncharacterized protein (TIGR00297 family)
VILSRLGRARKRELVDIGKGGARDALQVLANGGIATLCAVVWAFTHDIQWALAFAGAYAASTADTWATEIGTLAPGPPRSILTWRPLPTGMSGGVTFRGTLGEVAGALCIGVVTPIAIVLAYIAQQSNVGFAVAYTRWWGIAALALVIPLAGIVGSTVDSLLGAILQESRHCDACNRACETNPHVCGGPTRVVAGVPGISNDAVNFAATLTGATATVPLYALAGHIASIAHYTIPLPR